MTRIQQFITMCAQSAQRLGLQHVVVVVQDPQTKETTFTASMGALDALRPLIQQKIGADDDPNTGDTGWNDVW